MDIEKLHRDAQEIISRKGVAGTRAVLAVALRAAAEEAERINELPRSKALEDFMHTLSDLAAQLGDSDG